MPIWKPAKRAFTSKGQILLEALFFIVFVLSFLSAVRFFQSVARKNIQKERLSESQKTAPAEKEKAPPWLRPL